MTAREIISYTVPPIKGSDTGDRVLNWMSEFHVRHLPLVHDGALQGILSEDEVLNLPNSLEPLADLKPVLIRAAVQEDYHLYDVMKLIVDLDLTVVPVVDEAQNYLGLITLENVLKYFANTGSVAQPGGILILRMDARDYSMAEVARLIEGENTQILSSFISSPFNASKLELTLKLNKKDLKHVVATLERFKYDVYAAYHESDYLDTLQSRYDALMRYLDI